MDFQTEASERLGPTASSGWPVCKTAQLAAKELSPSSTSPIPPTSTARLSRAVPHFENAEKIESLSAPSLTDLADTVLYLAYGSNMAASTFEAHRGIRPISRIRVAVPTVQLTFDLPGLPYWEPCFANIALRRRVPDIPDKPPTIPPLPGPPGPTQPTRPFGQQDIISALGTPSQSASGFYTSRGDPVWNGALYGVVYEVSRDDYAHIVATEGGGASYQDIFVPCFGLPPSVSVPERPSLPEPPRPFLAHTLWFPQEPDRAMGRSVPSKAQRRCVHGDEHCRFPTPEWLKRRWQTLRRCLMRHAFIRPRPDPAYAQPSIRYLQLLIDGAHENELPQEYQAWLQSLTPYQLTTWRQRVGQVLFTVCAAPFVFLTVLLSNRTILPGRGQGRMPLWLLVITGILFHGMWWWYDTAMKPLFGDGERREQPNGSGRHVTTNRTNAVATFSSGQKHGMLESGARRAGNESGSDSIV